MDINSNPSVNRCLKDKALDHVDHALGRPTWPLRESYRNYFATGVNSEQGLAFDLSPWWERGILDGRLAYFHVTAAGRRALADHLKALGVDQVFIVSYGRDEHAVSARTPAKARYTRFLSISDVLPDLTFLEFLRRSTVRRAA